MKKLKKGDIVQVITGKDSGKRGEILSFVFKKGKRGAPDQSRVIVKGINIVKRSRKANPQLGIEGGVSEMEKGIDVSNVMLVDSKSDKPTRVKFKIDEKSGKKNRVSKNGTEI